MCGRVVWVWDAKTGRLLAKYADDVTDEDVRHVMEKERYNVPPTSHLPFVLPHGDGGRVEVAHWGFPVPQRPGGVFNTRIERAAESPLWRGLLGRSHALLVVKGFYEWDRSGGRKDPYFVHRADGEAMLLAALVGRRRVRGEQSLCASIVTCAPNEAVARLHDRMPVVLEEAGADDWLHPGRGGMQRVLDLAMPAAEGVLAMHRVGPRVNSTRNDGPDLIEPAAQRTLGDP